MAEHDQRLEQISHAISEAAITRRGFVMATLAAGFALAVRPVSAETLTTDQTGLTSGEIQIRTSDGHIAAYRARPEQETALPVVLVVQEIFGVHEHIKDICRRFAKLGYLAIAPELYTRQGDVSKLSDTNEIAAKVVSQVPDAQVLADLDAAVAWAKESGEGNVEKLGITGFCWGGRIVWLYAGAQSQTEGRSGLVWAAYRQTQHPATETPHRRGLVLKSSGAGCSAAIRIATLKSN